jgi:hypothetical protein
MPRPAPGSPWIETGRQHPFLIAHAANSPEKIVGYLDSGVDFLEMDLWVHDGSFESRHERAMYPLPFLFERWYITGRAPHFDLPDCVDMIDGRAKLFLDLKNGGRGVIPLMREALHRYPGLHVSASSPDWATLRVLHDNVQEVDVFYSMETPERLDLFLSVHDRDQRPVGVSCRARLLTPQLVDHLHELGLRVVAWTVDEQDRARRLADWGVDAITTHEPTAIRAALSP